MIRIVCGKIYDLVMRAVDETLITEAGHRLAAAAPDAQIILFGPHARGSACTHSDVDFLVVEPEVANEAEESVRLHRTLRDLRVPAKRHSSESRLRGPLAQRPRRPRPRRSLPRPGSRRMNMGRGF